MVKIARNNLPEALPPQVSEEQSKSLCLSFPRLQRDEAVVSRPSLYRNGRIVRSNLVLEVRNPMELLLGVFCRSSTCAHPLGHDCVGCSFPSDVFPTTVHPACIRVGSTFGSRVVFIAGVYVVCRLLDRLEASIFGVVVEGA